jgi:transposase
VAKRVEQLILGADVSQQWIDLHQHQTEVSERIDNTVTAIRAALKALPGPARLAVEATNTYHELLVAEALKLKIEVFLIDGYQLSHYREALRQRAKTDPGDARLLARFLANEGEQLTPFKPRTAAQQRLWRLLKRRATLVKTKTQLRQSLADVTELKRSIQALVRHIDRLLAQLDRRLKTLARSLGWQELIARCASIPGVGFLTALALVATYQRGHFASRDAFIAFMGLDVRVRDSGKHRGKRKLTKKGDAEIRRLLHCAAMAAARTPFFKSQYQALKARGLCATAAYVVIARKLARLAFALLRKETHFDPHKFNAPCAAT